MKRSKKLVFVAHCVINQNSVVPPLARAAGAFDFMSLLLSNQVGIEQLPCPEFKYLGISRSSMNLSEYDTPSYRKLCKELAASVVDDIIEYRKNEYEICGIICINQSPTCSITNPTGIFMQELLSILSQSNINLNYIEVPENYEEGEASIDFYNQVKRKFNLTDC